MADILHITSGDIAGKSLAQAGLPGEVFVWRDILYDGPRDPGWPDDDTLKARAVFLEETTAGGLHRDGVLETLRRQYQVLEEAGDRRGVVLWFDACLFDQSMLVHVLARLRDKGVANVELLCVDAFPGIEPFHGLGQLRPEQLASLYGDRRRVTDEQYGFAARVDAALATQDPAELAALSAMTAAPLPWIPAAVTRWLQERPDPADGLGRLERLALAAMRDGNRTPASIYAFVSAADTPPQFWGDITLWTRINALADRVPPLARIEGPSARLPQWAGPGLGDFTITALGD